MKTTSPILTKETFANHTTIEGATGLWNLCIEKYEWLKKRIPKENLLFVKYEDLVAAPEEVSKGILSFLGFEYENLERGRKEKVSKLGFTKSEHHANTSNEISVNRTAKWQTELTPEEIDQITARITPNLKKYGYI